MPFVPKTCLGRLRPGDFEFIGQVLNGSSLPVGDAFFRLAGDPDLLRLFLDDPKVVKAVSSLRQPIAVSAELYFYVMVRHALREGGIDHIDLADYVAGALVGFAEGNPFRTGSEDPLQIEEVPYHVDFIEAIHSASAYERFYLHVRCGNQFLVLTGLFPDSIRQRERRRGAPGVRYYEGVARESYRSARKHPLADEFALCEVYDVLSDQIRTTRLALNHLAMEYFWLG